jgi:hypothetical protein
VKFVQRLSAAEQYLQVGERRRRLDCYAGLIGTKMMPPMQGVGVTDGGK